MRLYDDMVWFFIPAVVMIVALVAIAFVFVRHFPQAAAIDLESLPAEQEAAMKAALLERRLQRKLAEMKNTILPFSRRLFQSLGKMFSSLYSRINQLEQRYRRKPQVLTPQQQKEMGLKIQTLLGQAKNLVLQQKWEEAEHAFIDVISWDAKNVEAYCGLGSVYFSQKQYVPAKETFTFLFKLLENQKKGEKISSFSSSLSESQENEASFDLVSSFHALGDLVRAKKQLGGLLQKDPKNPKFLDKMVELSILLKDRKAARQALDKLSEANPENQKIALFEEQIKTLL